VRQLNAAQCDRVIEHLVDMDPDPAVEGEDPT
jgi:hypothetical protein